MSNSFTFKHNDFMLLETVSNLITDKEIMWVINNQLLLGYIPTQEV